MSWWAVGFQGVYERWSDEILRLQLRGRCLLLYNMLSWWIWMWDAWLFYWGVPIALQSQISLESPWEEKTLCYEYDMYKDCKMAHATNPYSPTSVAGKRLVAETEVVESCLIFLQQSCRLRTRSDPVWVSYSQTVSPDRWWRIIGLTNESRRGERRFRITIGLHRFANTVSGLKVWYSDDILCTMV